MPTLLHPTNLSCLLLASAVPLLSQTELCPGMDHGPTILNPSTASCVYDAVNDSAVITFNQETVLDWARVDQRPSSSLTFNFVPGLGNASVLNRLGRLTGRDRTHRFDGVLNSNGRVVILSPESSVSLTGDITASELVAVVSETNPAGETALLQGDQAVDFIVNLSGSTTRLLTVSDASITSTEGDIVLGAARSTNILNSNLQPSTLTSAGSTRLFSGNRVRYDPSSNNSEKITPLPNNASNAVLQAGTIESGADVEISAADAGQILLDGSISANNGDGRIFLRVNNGTIDLSPNAILAGTLETTGTFQSVLFEGNEGDTPGTSSPSVGLFPSLRKGSATNREEARSKPVKVYQGAPVIANAEVTRTQSNSTQQAASAEKKKNDRALVQRSGFFGLRSAKVSKR